MAAEIGVRSGDIAMTVFEAIEAGDAERARELVAADPTTATERNADGVPAVLYARYWGRTEIVAVLLGTQPELDVHAAAALGRTARLRELLDGEPSRVDAWSGDGYQPLHLAAFFGHVDGVRLLLERGADVRAVARNPMLVQPLHSAAAAGEVEIARLLLEAGADPNAEQQDGFVPLDAARENDDETMQELLSAHGAAASRR
jgi:ankyrin repeat protein